MGAGEPPRVRVLLFDVFGTCVDWRGGIARAGENVARRCGITSIDWLAFADAWRRRYQPQLETVRSGARDWVELDVLHRESLDELLDAQRLDLGEQERVELTLAWHALDPWPDTVEGLRRLGARHVRAACSNGHRALVMSLMRHGALPFDAVLGAETARAYKPRPEVYLRSVAALGVVPGEAMMVAAHNSDLRAAAECGLRTAFVARPYEWGPEQSEDLEADPSVDVVAGDLIDLAERLDDWHTRADR
ncbi:MAG: haloacid dehalogenase type II [Thermoleophilia bacterium]